MLDHETYTHTHAFTYIHTHTQAGQNEVEYVENMRQKFNVQNEERHRKAKQALDEKNNQARQYAHVAFRVACDVWRVICGVWRVACHALLMVDFIWCGE